MIELPVPEQRPIGLLVSVRSAQEAVEAVRGGASIIDIKEPELGSLGRADSRVWKAVRNVVPLSVSVSVALGELAEWTGGAFDYTGIRYCKIGLANSGTDWKSDWARIRLIESGVAHWVGVAYSDWKQAHAPSPDEVLEAVIEADECSGILVDTFDKTKPSSLASTTQWITWVARARKSGKFVTLAGGLDLTEIARLAPLKPDLFAVRGAACQNGDRNGIISRNRVASLVEMIQESRV